MTWRPCAISPLVELSLSLGSLGGGSKGGRQLKTPQCSLVFCKVPLGSPRCLRYRPPPPPPWTPPTSRTSLSRNIGLGCGALLRGAGALASCYKQGAKSVPSQLMSQLRRLSLRISHGFGALEAMSTYLPVPFPATTLCCLREAPRAQVSQGSNGPSS